MKLIIQRVASGQIVINGGEAEQMGKGLIALVGFQQEDTKAVVDHMVSKMINLRIFDDENGNLNLALEDVQGALMVVPNFTLYANCKKGRRPSFIEAAKPDYAAELYQYMINIIRKTDKFPLISGEFGADMQVTICNDGPITIDLNSKDIM